jgi:3-oxoacyl-(acyl-carrier-protein) synthase
LADLPEYPVESFDATRCPSARVAEVRGFDPKRYLGDKGHRSLDRLTKLLVVASKLALEDAGIKKDGAFVALSPERVGLFASNAYGSLEAVAELDRVATLEDPRYVNPAKFPNTVHNSAAGYTSIWEDLRAFNVAVANGNTGALDAVVSAEIFLRAGRADAVALGGMEAMSELLCAAFERLGTMRGAPWLGEGAAILVLELPGATRVKRVLGHIVGAATAFVPSKGANVLMASSEALERAVRGALDDAGVSSVDLVASGLSGLGAYDDAERKALCNVLGDRVTLAAPKAIFGETLGASGAFGIAAVLAWFEGAPVAPIVSGPAPDHVDTVLVTSLGYYANASAVVLRRA